MDWTLSTIYLVSFALGLGVLLLQVGAMMFGGGHDADVGHVDVGHADIGHADSGEAHADDSSGGLNLFSVRTLAGFLAAFGLVGWGGAKAGWSTLGSLGAGLLAGTAMLFFTAWVFSNVRKLAAQGNLEPKNAVGRSARVYLRIPAANSGKGKITVSIQGRTAEFAASTRGPELATGSEVRVTKQITEDTFEVEAL